jgi:hypothetical protein
MLDGCRIYLPKFCIAFDGDYQVGATAFASGSKEAEAQSGRAVKRKAVPLINISYAGHPYNAR